MPRGKFGAVAAQQEHTGLLDVDELERIAAAFVDLGVSKLRLTGGEPLLRRDLPQLLERLSRLPLRDLCLTTNGSLLERQAQALANAGLHRITVSLDALDALTFMRMTDSRMHPSRVLAGIDAARRYGLDPVKINMVVKRGVNDHSVLPMAAWARRERLELRFIEYMDVGNTNGWRPSEVFTAGEILEQLNRVWPLAPATPVDRHATAERFRYQDGGGNVGVIAAVTRAFCGGCTRARVSALGGFHTCLFASAAVDLAGALRRGEDLRSLIAHVWENRTDRYSEARRVVQTARIRPEMSAIGG